ncbi:hypothetical protein HZH66_002622 [Vespula vulgaris]|uniref:Uncharacterized protein n=1 Tax=Vespula vulgaris TaxID=7454 RepID=A0A834KK35_VESVU|nr:hypothetical protein HZH66_002622 [Vespula vulgaris]
MIGGRRRDRVADADFFRSEDPGRTLIVTGEARNRAVTQQRPKYMDVRYLASLTDLSCSVNSSASLSCTNLLIVSDHSINLLISFTHNDIELIGEISLRIVDLHSSVRRTVVEIGVGSRMDKTHASPPPPHTEDTANKNERNRKKFERGLLTNRVRKTDTALISGGHPWDENIS